MRFIQSFLLSISLVSCATFPKVHETLPIYEISSMTQVERWITPGTLVIFDLDNTLFESRDMEAHANWYHDMMLKRPHEQPKILARIWKAIKKATFEPVEPQTPDLIRKWQNKRIAVMALTARDLELEEATLHQVKKVGVDFSKTSPHRNSRHFKEGILFSSADYPKGKALNAFLAGTGFKPARIVLIDDVKKNLVSVCQESGAIGLYYPLVENKRSTHWNVEEAERLWHLE